MASSEMAPAKAEFLESPLLTREGFVHAFYTRRGGCTPAPFDSLHFGAAGQSADDLAANVGAAAGALAIDPSRLYTATQVHGRDVMVVHGTENRADLLRKKGDAVVTTTAGVACGVKVADCVPLLIGDRASGAVAAIHSGWQGTEVNVVAAAVAALQSEIGSAGDFVAAIGPHIEVCCFEVGDDVALRLSACAPDESTVDRRRGSRPHVNLRKIVRVQLERAGIFDESIDDVRGCTKCDALRFFLIAATATTAVVFSPPSSRARSERAAKRGAASTFCATALTQGETAVRAFEIPSLA
jgi:YfiH family protein